MKIQEYSHDFSLAYSKTKSLLASSKEELCKRGERIDSKQYKGNAFKKKI